MEGLVLLTVLLVVSRRRRPEGTILGVFLLLYGTFRFTIEFVRQPDPQLGFIAAWLTMGQLLSIPLIIAGAWLLIRAWRLGREERRPLES